MHWKTTATAMALGTVLVVLALGIVAGQEGPEPWLQEQKFVDDDPEDEDFFGHDVALSGNTAVIGRSHETIEDAQYGEEAGAVSIYERVAGAWVETAELEGPLPMARFGSTVAVDGDTVAVGAWGRLTDQGCHFSAAKVYLFERTDDGWVQDQVLDHPDEEPHKSCYGETLDLDQEKLIVGASEPNKRSYIYQRNEQGWSLDATLEGLTTGFGNGVDIESGAGLAAVADQHRDINLVYLFRESGDGWTKEAELSAPGAGNIGESLEISDDGSFVASHDSEYSEGPVWVWQMDQADEWSLWDTLYPSDARDSDPYISSLEIDGNRLAVGAYLDDLSPSASTPEDLPCVAASPLVLHVIDTCWNGAVYLFSTDGESWTQTAKVLANDDFGIDAFGWSLGLSGDTLLVGAPSNYQLVRDRGSLPHDPATFVLSEDHGAAYVFTGGQLDALSPQGVD